MNTPRIGIHLSTSGGVFKAAERAHEIGANTFQIFSSSPRMWRPARIDAAHALQLHELRREYDCTPLVIHTSYLLNLCSQSQEVCRKSVVAFRGEVERALALGADYLVLHPGSWRGLTREAGLSLAAESIAKATDGLCLEEDGLRRGGPGRGAPGEDADQGEHDKVPPHIHFLLRLLQRAGVPSFIGRKQKKAGVLEHPEGFQHAGLLVTEPPGHAGLPFV